MWSGFERDLVFVGLLLLRQIHAEPTSTFGGLFMADSFGLLMKGIILFGVIKAVLLAMPYWNYNQATAKPEYPVLILLATVGMFCMVSSNDLLTTYIGLELQSFSLYILASFQRDERFNSEAGLKYFFLGASVIGRVAVWHVIGLRLCRHDTLSGAQPVVQQCAAVASRFDYRNGYGHQRYGLQDCGGPVPHVGARCVSGRSDTGHRVFRDGTKGRCVRHDYSV